MHSFQRDEIHLTGVISLEFPVIIQVNLKRCFIPSLSLVLSSLSAKLDGLSDIKPSGLRSCTTTLSSLPRGEMAESYSYSAPAANGLQQHFTKIQQCTSAGQRWQKLWLESRNDPMLLPKEKYNTILLWHGEVAADSFDLDYSHAAGISALFRFLSRLYFFLIKAIII